MNYIKVTAEFGNDAYKLFVKEKDCYNLLHLIREIHMCKDVRHGALSVTIRKVRVKNNYGYARSRLKELCDNSFSLLQRLEQSYKVAA